MNNPTPRALWFWGTLGSPDRWASEDDARMIVESLHQAEPLDQDDIDYLTGLDEEDAEDGPEHGSPKASPRA
jgi:hypothetical protein